MGARRFREANAYLHQLQDECTKVETQIEGLTEALDDNSSEYMKLLSKELADLGNEQPTLSAALLDLTRLIPDEMWVQSFNWADGKIELQLSAKSEKEGLLQDLEDSPILGDVVPGRKTRSHDSILTIRLQMNARYDTEAELKNANAPATDEGK